MMKKKNGFTLAEVLITLTIIGVVAMMTLPALMTNVQEQQAKTGLKKGINTLTEAAQMNQAVEGFGYADLVAEGNVTSMDDLAQEQTLRGLLMSRAQVDTRLSKVGYSDTNPEELQAYMTATNNPVIGRSIDRVIAFRDGSALLYNFKDSIATTDNTKLQADGLPLGFVAVYDMNGLKGPNLLSNCDHNASTAKSDIDEGEFAPNIDKCKDRKERVIRDQFLVRLRGASVTPGSAAAKWVMDN